MQVLLVALAFAATAMAANVSTISNNNLVIGQAATFRVNLKFVSNGSIYQSAMFQTAVDDFSVVQIPLCSHSFFSLTHKPSTISQVLFSATTSETTSTSRCLPST
jgi:hypothetical protein